LASDEICLTFTKYHRPTPFLITALNAVNDDLSYVTKFVQEYGHEVLNKGRCGGILKDDQ
jgi:hypothetical protein